MGSPAVFSAFKDRLPTTLAMSAMLVLSLLGSAEASGQRSSESKRTAPAIAAATPPMAINGAQRGKVRERAAPALIEVRPLDVGALAPSAFADWDHAGADQLQQ